MAKLNSELAMKAASDMHVIRHFMSADQKLAIREGLRGEEAEFFAQKLHEFAERIRTMPVVYEQESRGTDIAYLHYFKNGMDWYILEKDIPDEDGEAQVQAFGQANLGYGTELGYIPIIELIECGVELDLYFEPTSLAQINASLPGDR